MCASQPEQALETMTSLPDTLAQRWTRYLNLERAGQRRQALAVLSSFILDLLALDSRIWYEWASEFTAQVLTPGSRLPLRTPFVQQVLMPALATGVQQKHPERARQLAEIVERIGGSALWPMSLAPELHSVTALLEEALRQDPKDIQARTLLIHRQARFIAYTLHELPSGVLYDVDGATAEQCLVLLSELQTFEDLIRTSSTPGLHAELIKEARFHYQAYAEYLHGNTPGGSYQHFLVTVQHEKDLALPE